MHTRLVVAGLVSAALALAACGSSGGKTVSKAEFLRKGNDLCATAKTDVDKLKSPDADPQSDLTKAQLKEIGDYLDKAIPIQNRLIGKLRDLGAPAGDASKLSKLYDESDSGTKELTTAANQAHNGNQASFRDHLKKGGDKLDAAQKGVTDYGLDKCGSV
jgi:hypothetical protein